jgi:hypothetical protein
LVEAQLRAEEMYPLTSSAHIQVFLRQCLCGLVRLTVGAGNDHRVPVRVLDPDLAMAGTVTLALRWVPVKRSYDRRLELLRSRDDVVKVGHFAEPQQDTVANFDVWAHKQTMVVLDVAVVQLKDKNAVGEQSLVLRASMITPQA